MLTHAVRELSIAIGFTAIAGYIADVVLVTAISKIERSWPNHGATIYVVSRNPSGSRAGAFR
jgi:hypothetical protein